MKKQLVNFDFNGNAVRVYVDKEGATWFVAVDVCKVLTLANPRQAISKLDDDERKQVTFSSVSKLDGVKNQQLNANQKLNVVNESGLYSLILTSNKPEAKKFKKWITSEVLPKIRKTGKYDLAAEQDKFAAIKAHLERSTQVQNSKRANGMNYRIGGAKEVVSWNYTNCLEQTGYAPKDWREYGRSEGLPAKYCQSAKEVLRHMDQVAACCMSMADDVMVSNQRATPMDAIRIGKLSSPVFRELLALGIIPAELHWMNRESDKNAA